MTCDYSPGRYLPLKLSRGAMSVLVVERGGASAQKPLTYFGVTNGAGDCVPRRPKVLPIVP